MEVDEALTVFAATLEDWVTPRQNWELQLARLTSNGVDVELFHIRTFT